VKRLILFVAIVGFGVFTSALPRPATALENWPPLLNCSDVNADGHVDMIDIGWIVLKFGTVYPMDNYQLLYDVSGGGAVNVLDIATAIRDFGRICPPIETQVAQATLALIGAYGGPDLRDPAQAAAAGYIQDSQDVAQMGIHMDNPLYLTAWPNCCSLGLPGEAGESQLIHPVGLVYTEAPGGGPDELIGGWYLVPNDEVCAFYGIPGPCQSNAEQPLGFGLTNADEDNQDPVGAQAGWHVHNGLCVWNWGTTSALTLENVAQQYCETSGGIWFSTYGWMLHLYNVIPNPAGRFMLWSSNVP
jgi:hypothetical protein